MADRQVLLSDIERAIATRDPQLADLVIAFLQQGDPPPGRPEVDEAGPNEGAAPEPSPDDWTLPRLRKTLAPAKLAAMTGSEQKAARLEAWEALMASPNPPPRLRLGAMLVALYEAGDEPGRTALARVFAEGRLSWGVWLAVRRVYKTAEARHDARMFGVLAARLDRLPRTPHDSSEISPGSALYFKRRAWRWLRQLGQAVPALYPDFAVEVLKNYPADHHAASAWIPSQVWGHKRLIGQRDGGTSLPRDLAGRAFPDAWKTSPAPLLRLLEDAPNDTICEFAILSLKKDFADVVRRPEPAWLARLGQKRLSSVDSFLVDVLKSSPELHQSKLRGLGLHELVLGLLRSDSDAARTYAIEYARAHAADMSAAELLALLDAEDDVKEFAVARLQAIGPRALGLRALAQLVDVDEAQKWAEKAVRENFKPADFDAETFAVFYGTSDETRAVLVKLFQAAKAKIPAAFLLPLAVAPDTDWSARRAAIEELGKRDGAEIGLDWAKKNLDKREVESAIKRWVQSGKWKGDALDLEWLKGLVLRARHRSFAIAALADRELVPAARLGLGWLLEMARRPEDDVRGFAETALLEAFAPSDFAPGKPLAEGIDRLFQLASGADQPDAVRAFAATYLKVHHPDLHGSTPEARQHAVTPRLDHDAFTLARVRPLFDDPRPDVRRLGVAIAKHELARWGDPAVLYAMADSRSPEVRGAGCDLLLAIGEGERALPIAWLDAGRVFTLAESPNKATRETALAVIRRHYERIGSAERLGWLMDSPERDVQIFAVRLLWDRHRPRATPAGWTPRKPIAGLPLAAEPFSSEEALRQFLRTLLFGLPPGRLERRDPGEAARARPLPASVAKRRAIEVTRDLAVEDAAFARTIQPVLEEFLASQAKGEWQACVAALATIRRAHPDMKTALPAPAPPSAKPRAAATPANPR